jgi:hypothetical protein
MDKECFDKFMKAGKNRFYYDRSNGKFKDCESVIVKTIFPSSDGMTQARVAFAQDNRRGHEVVPISALFDITSDGSLTK